MELILRSRDGHHEKPGPQGLRRWALANQRKAKRDIDRPGCPGRTDDNPPLDANLYGETVAAQDAFTGGLREARLIAQAERRILGSGIVDRQGRCALAILNARTFDLGGARRQLRRRRIEVSRIPREKALHSTGERRPGRPPRPPCRRPPTRSPSR